MPIDPAGVPSISRRALARSGFALAGAALAGSAAAAAPTRVQPLIPELEAYIQSGMPAFGVPGAAIAIVSGDQVVYAKGFGVRQLGDADAVTPDTVFQAGSTTKAFLATVLAIAVDRHKLKWTDRVVDLYPEFSLRDPYVTREFRVFDLLAQRSGLAPYANDFFAPLGYDQDWMIHSLRYARPISSFRTTFAYTNITHLIAGRIAGKALDAPDWPTLVTREIMQPLGMQTVTFTADAINTAPDHAAGYRWTAQGPAAVPYYAAFPYGFGPAGDINTSVMAYTPWLRMLLGKGMFAGKRIVSAENLGATWIARVGMDPQHSYAMGWVINQTPNGTIIWHNGGTEGGGAYVGLLPDHDYGVVVLSNQGNRGFPDAVGAWLLDHLLGNPPSDPMSVALKQVQAQDQETRKLYTRPASPADSPALDTVAGTYVSPAFGPANVAAQDPGLMVTLEKTGARLRLDPFDGAVFTASLVSEGQFAPMVAASGDGRIGFINFQSGADGRLTRMQLASEGQSFVFRRR